MSLVEVTTDTIENIVKTNSVVVFDFWAEWCGPYKIFKQIFEKIDPEYLNVMFCTVNTGSESKLTQYLQVRSIPGIIFFREGILVHQNTFQRLMDDVLGLDIV